MDNLTHMYFVDLLFAQSVITICIYISFRVLLTVYVKIMTWKEILKWFIEQDFCYTVKLMSVVKSFSWNERNTGLFVNIESF
jgi:hypothetical protein